jgi:hypothetical protein
MATLIFIAMIIDVFMTYIVWGEFSIIDVANGVISMALVASSLTWAGPGVFGDIIYPAFVLAWQIVIDLVDVVALVPWWVMLPLQLTVVMSLMSLLVMSVAGVFRNPSSRLMILYSWMTFLQSINNNLVMTLWVMPWLVPPVIGSWCRLLAAIIYAPYNMVSG